MNKEVSFELAQLLKDKGFEVKIRPYFFEKSIGSGSYMYNHKGLLELCTMPRVGLENGWIDAPNISDVIMWLYEKHDIWISVIPESSSGHKLLDRKFAVSIFKFQINLNVQAQILRKDKDILYFNLPENAIEYAIEHTLNNLI